MIIYLAGGLNMPDVMKACNAKNVLSSWLENKEKFYKDYNIFLDCGAFTAWTQGKQIDVYEYIKHIKQHEEHLGVYAALDVIENDAATYKNFNIMKEAGLNPMPTFHANEDYKYLRQYLETEEYIALGGMVGSGREVLEPYLDNCWSIIKEYWPKKVHGFGLTSWWALNKYPFYSVDSTGWLAGGKFGRLMRLEDLQLSSDHYLDKDLIHKYGRRYYDVVDHVGGKSYKGRNKHNVEVYLKLQDLVTEVWAERGIVWN